MKALPGIVCILISVSVFSQSSNLARNFRNPPAEYSLLPFWSWNGTLKPEKLTWQIDQMLEKGIYGAFLHARAGLDESETPYFSEGFWNAVDTTVKYSAANGFHAYLYDEDKWPSGSAGGRTIAANPDDFVKKALACAQTEVTGPQTIRLNLQKNPLAVFAGRMRENGNYDYSSQIRLDDRINPEWNVPAGRWMVTSFEMVKDPSGQIDYLDSAAVAEFISITHSEYFKRFGQYFGTTIPGVFFDEIYANFSKMDMNIFWTDDFLQQFRKLKGYDLTGKLPLILCNDPVWSAKVRYDYFDVVKELYVNAWFKQYAGWCADHQIWATGHTTEKLIHYKRQSDYFSTMGQLQVPGADNEEYRYGFPRMIDWYNTKQISSIGNLFNRKRVMAESMGGGGYTIPPEEYRYGFAMLGVYGINLFIPHLFHYITDTPESQADWPPSWFYSNPYWKYFKPLANYASRISFLNSQGNEVCDVAILYPLADLWENAYSGPVDDTFYREVQQILLDSHINYNIIDPASLANAKIENRKIAAGKGNYAVLVLPDILFIRMDVLKQVEHFVRSGGILISLKGLPSLSENGTREGEQVAATMKNLFGFGPTELQPGEYYQWNAQRTEHFTAHSNSAGGTAYFTRFLSQLPVIINRCINPDFVVKSENARFLQFRHRHVDKQEFYLLVNDRNKPECYHVSLRNRGRPSVWNPETGDTLLFDNYELRDGRMELFLDFKPRESYFLVLDENKPDTGSGVVESTDLIDYRLSGNNEVLKVEGWGKTGQTHSLVCKRNGRVIRKEWTGRQNLPELKLSGDWNFRIVPHKLDYQWSANPQIDTLALPVMKFRAERKRGEGTRQYWSADHYDDTGWKTVKITDVYSKKAGIQRYLSGWDAWWISYYDYSVHLPAIGGGNRVFRKEIALDSPVREALLAVTADTDYELLVNGQTAGKDQDWKTAEKYNISEYLKPGKNLLEVKTGNTQGLLLQGHVNLKNGKILTLRSDSSWMVSSGGRENQNAFQFTAPPLGIWGNITNPLQKVEFPLTVWYRQQIPPGITAIKKPQIKGRYTLFINGKPVPSGAEETISIGSFLKTGTDRVALRVEATDETCGLLNPVEMVCGSTGLPLSSWNEQGLGWYSGRALYTKTVEIPAAYLNQETRLVLDPGEVHYFAEIWVNGELVKFFPWAPFEADITGFAKPGKNEISIVVSNLSANEAGWNILDDNISNKEARWWHDGSLMREKEKLISGLTGPVAIIPYFRETVMME